MNVLRFSDLCAQGKAQRLDAGKGGQCVADFGFFGGAIHSGDVIERRTRRQRAWRKGCGGRGSSIGVFVPVPISMIMVMLAALALVLAVCVAVCVLVRVLVRGLFVRC